MMNQIRKTGHNQHKSRDVSADSAQILQPFPRSHSDDVHKNNYPQGNQSASDKVMPILIQTCVFLANSKRGNDSSGDQQIWIIENVINPITPSAQETVTFTECALSPEIDSALLWKPRR